MFILESLLAPIPFRTFCDDYLGRVPLSGSSVNLGFRKVIDWDFFFEVFSSGHRDCWLPSRGRLPERIESGSTGNLTIEEAMKGFTSGRTILIRHSERAHLFPRQLANEFEELFRAPINVHVYATPAGQQGFDWHYDVEDVFVLQSSGVKEFYLRKPVFEKLPATMLQPSTHEELESYCSGPVLACRMEPGDWLYIPAGWWHKAKAEENSFHFSVGVLRQDR